MARHSSSLARRQPTRGQTRSQNTPYLVKPAKALLLNSSARPGLPATAPCCCAKGRLWLHTDSRQKGPRGPHEDSSVRRVQDQTSVGQEHTDPLGCLEAARSVEPNGLTVNTGRADSSGPGLCIIPPSGALLIQSTRSLKIQMARAPAASSGIPAHNLGSGVLRRPEQRQSKSNVYTPATASHPHCLETKALLLLMAAVPQECSWKGGDWWLLGYFQPASRVDKQMTIQPTSSSRGQI